MTGTAATVVAQAKTNLFLRVLAREAGGYHSIETLFVRLDLADDVTVRIGGSRHTVSSRGEDTGPPERNLAVRAAEAYAQATGWPSGSAIAIEKRIPVGAGLGGGSADAGAVLRALNALAPRPVPESILLAIGTALGADVPFLTSTAPMALAWGRGERFLALPALDPRHVDLIVPAVRVATADAYRWLAATREHAAWEAPSRALTPADLARWESVAPLAQNDFEEVVSAHCPAVRRALRQARGSGALVALLSGSGSAVCAIGARSGWITADVGAAESAAVIATRTAARVVPVTVIE